MARNNLSLLLVLFCVCCGLANGCQPLAKICDDYLNGGGNLLPATSTLAPTTTVEPTTVEPTTTTPRAPVQFHITAHLPEEADCKFDAPNANISVQLVRRSAGQISHTQWVKLHQSGPSKRRFESETVLIHPKECAKPESVCDESDALVVKYNGKDIYISYFEGTVDGKPFRYGNDHLVRCHNTTQMNQWIGKSGTCKQYFQNEDAHFVYDKNGVRGALNKEDFDSYYHGYLEDLPKSCNHKFGWKLEPIGIRLASSPRPRNSSLWLTPVGRPGSTECHRQRYDDQSNQAQIDFVDTKYTLVRFNEDGQPWLSDSKPSPINAVPSSSDPSNATGLFNADESVLGHLVYDNVDAILIKFTGKQPFWPLGFLLTYDENPSKQVPFLPPTMCNRTEFEHWIGVRSGSCKDYFGPENVPQFFLYGRRGVITAFNDHSVNLFLSGHLHQTDFDGPCRSVNEGDYLN